MKIEALRDRIEKANLKYNFTFVPYSKYCNYSVLYANPSISILILWPGNINKISITLSAITN